MTIKTKNLTCPFCGSKEITFCDSFGYMRLYEFTCTACDIIISIRAENSEEAQEKFKKRS